MTAGDLLAIGAIVFGAFVARGVTGFGSATLAVPMLVHFIPLRTAVPLLLVLDFASEHRAASHRSLEDRSVGSRLAAAVRDVRGRAGRDASGAAARHVAARVARCRRHRV